MMIRTSPNLAHLEENIDAVVGAFPDNTVTKQMTTLFGSVFVLTFLGLLVSGSLLRFKYKKILSPCHIRNKEDFFFFF